MSSNKARGGGGGGGGADSSGGRDEVGQSMFYFWSTMLWSNSNMEGQWLLS